MKLLEEIKKIEDNVLTKEQIEALKKSHDFGKSFFEENKENIASGLMDWLWEKHPHTANDLQETKLTKEQREKILKINPDAAYYFINELSEEDIVYLVQNHLDAFRRIMQKKQGEYYVFKDLLDKKTITII